MIQTLRLNPFRVFFPLGILFALVGVGEWAFWSVGWRVPAVSFTHTSLQAQGFLACFVVGFLMTAFPRFTGTEPVSFIELVLGTTAAVSFFINTLFRQYIPAETSFLVLIGVLIVFAARRMATKSKPLPPSFLLMGFGFLHALSGPVLMMISDFGNSNLALYTVGRQMVQLGFLLCVVLGVTGQLAPFLMGHTAEPNMTPRNPRWAHALTGALVYASFWLIPLNERAALVLRAVVVSVHFVMFAKITRGVLKKTALIYFFTLSMRLIPLGLWVAALWPTYRIAALHIVFIGGFSLMIFSFGQLIVISHSERAPLLNGRLIPMKIIGAGVLVAMGLRVTADVFGNAYMMLIHAASGVWVLMAAFWLVYLFPMMFGSKKG